MLLRHHPRRPEDHIGVVGMSEDGDGELRKAWSSLPTPETQPSGALPPHPEEQEELPA